MDNTPIISIIIPVYNAEEHIEECFKSILNQTFKDFEIICIDDGSTDNSLKILYEQARLDKRIKILTQGNCGPGKARNCGLENAKGSFICFIDIDDNFYDNNALMNLIVTQKRYKSDLVIGKISVIDFNNNEQIKIRGWNKVKSNVLYKTEELYNNLFQCISVPVFAKLYKKEIIQNYKINFNNYKAAEDMLFVYTYILHCSSMVFIEDLIVNYKVLQANSLSSFNSSYLLDSCNAYRDLKQVIEDKGLDKLLNRSLLNSYVCCFGYVFKRVSFINKLRILKKFLLMGVNILCK